MIIIQSFERFPAQADCIVHLERARWGGGPGRWHKRGWGTGKAPV